MDIFTFKIVWRKSQVWRGFYGVHEGHKLKVRHQKKIGWRLFYDGRVISGTPHPLGFALLLRHAEEMFINKLTAAEALRIAEEYFANVQTRAHRPAPCEATAGIGAGEGGVAPVE